jgi:hypothetical protein
MKPANNRSHAKLTQLKVSVDPAIASAFKAACMSSNVSMVAELSQFMLDYAKCEVKHKAAPDYSTRRKRRVIVKRILHELEEIKLAEECLISNAPENLQEAPIYETAHDYISALEESIDQLSSMVS